MAIVKKIKFGKLKIQKLNRIALPISLLENLDIEVGDNVDIYLDIEKNEIIIEKSKENKKEAKKKRK